MRAERVPFWRGSVEKRLHILKHILRLVEVLDEGFSFGRCNARGLSG